MPDARLDLAALLAELGEAEVPAEQLPAALAALAAAQGRLAARLLEGTRPSSPSPSSSSSSSEADRMLTAQEAAAVAGVSAKWLYRNAGKLPFTRRLSPGIVRFSEAGLRRWLATRKA